jgi:hypothetical protein
MFVVTGTYNFLPKVVAFRSDYCRHCQSETISFARRTVDAFHLFWIPIFPLGIWTRWYCHQCGERPHEANTIRKWVRVLVVAFFLLLSLPMWISALAPILGLVPQSTDDKGNLIGALLISVLLVLSFIWARGFRSDEIMSRIREVQTFVGHSCPICSGSLDISSTLTCRECGAENRPL